jgi:hypothetical protein
MCTAAVPESKAPDAVRSLERANLEQDIIGKAAVIEAFFAIAPAGFDRTNPFAPDDDRVMPLCTGLEAIAREIREGLERLAIEK